MIVALDLIFQHFSGFNVFGFEINEYGATGLFLDERIAGTFVKNFGFFLIFFTFLKSKKNNLFDIIFLPVIISILSISIFVTMQRMPMIMWAFFLLFYGIFYYKTKLKSIVISFLIVFLFISTVPSAEKISSRYLSFRDDALQLVSKTLLVHEIFINKEKLKKFQKEEGGLGSNRSTVNSGAGHANLYANSIVIWKSHKIAGIGIKNFYSKCTEFKMYMCSSHPHNYYFEILVSTGIIGIISILIFLLITFFKTIKQLKIEFKNKKSFKSDLLLLFFIIFLMFFFPVQSTGSFFSTSNATYVTVILSFLNSTFLKKNIDNS